MRTVAGRPIRTAILGYGRSGSTLHADPIGGNPEFSLRAVCDVDAAAREKAKARFGCPVHEDYRAMLRAGGLDLVVIVTRSHQHAAMAEDCLRAGVATLVTKPWAVDAEEARGMIRASRESGAPLLPWLPARWGCDLERLRRIVAEGTIGRVFQVRRGEYTLGTRSDWQTERRCGGGYLLNWGPHVVDQPLQLLGGRVRNVRAVLRQVANPGDAEDVFFALMEMEDGRFVTAEFNYGAPGLPTWTVQGDRGTVFVRDMEVEIHRIEGRDASDPSSYRGSPKVEVTRERLDADPSASRFGDNRAVYAHIADALTGRAEYAVSPESALELSRVLDAIRRSSETGAAVPLEPQGL